MIISLVAAISENDVIGKERGMPWYMPADLRYFYKLTKNHHVIMGHRTFHEFGVSKPLPDRTNIILSKQAGLKIEGCIVYNSINDAIDFAYSNHESELFIIGGGNIYRQAIEIADKLYITVIHTVIEKGDTFFPDIDEKIWKLISSDFHLKDTANPFNYTFKIYVRA